VDVFGPVLQALIRSWHGAGASKRPLRILCWCRQNGADRGSKFAAATWRRIGERLGGTEASPPRNFIARRHAVGQQSNCTGFGVEATQCPAWHRSGLVHRARMVEQERTRCPDQLFPGLLAFAAACVDDAFDQLGPQSHGRHQSHRFGIRDANWIVATVAAAQAARQLRMILGLIQQWLDRLVYASRTIRVSPSRRPLVVP
tara:strand:- start:4056 stop:4658 length:603 start_codon:yes stop_codon:yes gene_type:complete